MKKSLWMVVLLYLFLCQSLWAKKKVVLCVGAALCPMAEQIIQRVEVSPEDDYDFIEYPIDLKGEEIKKIPKPEIILSHPFEVIGEWRDFVFNRFFEEPPAVYVLPKDNTLNYIYPKSMMFFKFPSSVSLPQDDNQMFYPFFFYPKAILMAYESLYGFLSKHFALTNGRIHGYFHEEELTYNFESCLGTSSRKENVLFIFPSQVLGIFFAHLGIPHIIIPDLNMMHIKKLNLNQSKRVVFFNVDKSLHKDITKVFGAKKVVFWEVDYSSKSGPILPGLFLNKVFRQAIVVAGLEKHCLNQKKKN